MQLLLFLSVFLSIYCGAIQTAFQIVIRAKRRFPVANGKAIRAPLPYPMCKPPFKEKSDPVA